MWLSSSLSMVLLGPPICPGCMPPLTPPGPGPWGSLPNPGGGWADNFLLASVLREVVIIVPSPPRTSIEGRRRVSPGKAGGPIVPPGEGLYAGGGGPPLLPSKYGVSLLFTFMLYRIASSSWGWVCCSPRRQSRDRGRGGRGPRQYFGHSPNEAPLLHEVDGFPRFLAAR